jgi:magnesium-protoporphyrin IX monomethyl ester (oxidative) cyclase
MNLDSAESMLQSQIPAKGSINESTKMALEDAVLSPRFYTTNFKEMDRISIDSLRPEWDALMAEYEGDNNADHFQRPADMDKDYSNLHPALYDEFVEFLISSITSEFSGCILYAEIKRKVTNPDMRNLFGYMARDESRHAGFINQWLKDFNIGIDLGFLAKRRNIPTFNRSLFFMPPTSPRRLAMRVTSPFSGNLKVALKHAFIRSSYGLSAGVMMSSAMVNPLR